MILLSSFNSSPTPILRNSPPHGGCRHCVPSYVSTAASSAPLRHGLDSIFCVLKWKAYSVQGDERTRIISEEEALGDDNEEDEDFQVATAIRSPYNEIVILDTPKSRMLLLDSSQSVHSVFNKGGGKWTGCYWDEFACLPAIVPEGPIAILGLGGGTVAHQMLDVWPERKIEGWEIDGILIDKAREFLGLSSLETPNQAGGVLNVHVGDALSSATAVPGGFAGIFVDLFSEGKVLPELQEVGTWLDLSNKLMPNGRLMVNCGAADDDGSISKTTQPETSLMDESWVQNSTIRAMCLAFPGQLSWKKMPKQSGQNYLALTGSLPDLTSWSAALPDDKLSLSVKQWRKCCPL